MIKILQQKDFRGSGVIWFTTLGGNLKQVVTLHPQSRAEDNGLMSEMRVLSSASLLLESSGSSASDVPQWVGILTSINVTKKSLHRYGQRPNSQVILSCDIDN